MIRFACSNCQMAVDVPPQRAGKRVKCPYCFSPVAVPRASEVLASRAANRGRTGPSWLRRIFTFSGV